MCINPSYIEVQDILIKLPFCHFQTKGSSNFLLCSEIRFQVSPLQCSGLWILYQTRGSDLPLQQRQGQGPTSAHQRLGRSKGDGV